MKTALEIIGWVLAIGTASAAVVMLAAIGWVAGRWKIYGAAYLTTRALADKAQRLHHWACRLPKEPPSPGMYGGLYEGPIKIADVKSVELDGQPLEKMGYAEGHQPLEPMDRCQLFDQEEAPAETSIVDLLKEAGLGEEIDPDD